MYYNNNDVRVEEIPVPEIDKGELLMRVHAAGICGSDVMEWYRVNKAPLVLGHEIAGEVVNIGNEVTQYRKGDRVCVAHHVPCNKCHYCVMGHQTVCETLRQTSLEPGGFSEYVRVPEINVEYGVYLLPNEVSFDEATFVEPLACVLRGQRLAQIKQNQTVVVIGCGIAGLLHIHLAKIKGIERIVATDIVEYRLKQAKKFGADFIINANGDISGYIRSVNENRLADMVILCSGATSAIKKALELVERGGTILFFAPSNQNISVPISINKFFWKTEITFTSSYAGSPDDYKKALELIAQHKLNLQEMITHKLPLDKIEEGFKLVAKAQDSIKVIIEPQKQEG